MKRTDFYGESGVDAFKKDVHKAIKNTDAGLFPRAFCKIKQDLWQNDWARVTHSDGVGTKLTTQYLMYRENGNPAPFRHSAQDSAVMNLDDMMCVGVVDNIVGTNVIDRDPSVIGGDVVSEVISGYDEFAEMLRQHGVNVFMDSGETADVGDVVRTISMNSSWSARLPKDQLITFDKVSPGNVIIGLSSAGQSIYETTENSGIRSNGLTAAKRLLLRKEYQDKYPEIVSPGAKVGYQGKFMLDDKLPGSKMTVGQALTSPTRTYLPIVKYILENHPGVINGIVHNSGGGLSKSMNYGNGLHYLKNDLMTVPPVFNALAIAGKMDQHEMFKSFNNGVGLEIYTDPKHTGTILKIAQSFEVDAKVIGEIAKSKDDRNHVTIRQGDEEYYYSK
jgi:phosphoribosylformylglycinamidine cyclo-ligase